MYTMAFDLVFHETSLKPDFFDKTTCLLDTSKPVACSLTQTHKLDGTSSQHAKHEQTEHVPLCLNSNAFVQVGAPGSIPDEVRQDIIAPLQDLPGILEVCGLKPNRTAYCKLGCRQKFLQPHAMTCMNSKVDK